MNPIALQTGADPAIHSALRGVFQVQRDEPAHDWCVAAPAPPARSARKR